MKSKKNDTYAKKLLRDKKNPETEEDVKINSESLDTVKDFFEVEDFLSSYTDKEVPTYLVTAVLNNISSIRVTNFWDSKVTLALTTWRKAFAGAAAAAVLVGGLLIGTTYNRESSYSNNSYEYATENFSFATETLASYFGEE